MRGRWVLAGVAERDGEGISEREVGGEKIHFDPVGGQWGISDGS